MAGGDFREASSRDRTPVRRRLHLFTVLCWSLAASQAGGDPATGVVCALPVVIGAGLRDIQESWLNGPEGYAFVVEFGAEKTGDLPVQVGRDPARRFDTTVYASNFQGPVLVRRPNLRPQWEWTAAGEMQISDRQYPMLAGRACAERASALPSITLHVAEHDEWPWGNDPVGAFVLDLGRCKDVLPNSEAGWTPRHHSEGVAYSDMRDVAFVEYVLWCYTCEGASDCEHGIVWEASERD